MEIKITYTQENFGREIGVGALFDRSELMPQMFIAAVERAAELIADKFVAECGQEIMKAMSPEAIANLAVANSGATIATELKKEAATRTRIVENVKNEIYQKGIFGGLKKL